MATYSQNFDIDVPYSTLWEWSETVAKSYDNGWKVEIKTNGQIIMKEKGILHLTHNPAKAEIFVSSITSAKSQLKVVVSNFGVALNSIFVNEMGKELSRKIIEKWATQQIDDIKLRVGIETGLICPKCHTEMPPGIKFCPNDGTPISKMCRNCEAPNMPSSQFCHNCGKPL